MPGPFTRLPGIGKECVATTLQPILRAAGDGCRLGIRDGFARKAKLLHRAYYFAAGIERGHGYCVLFVIRWVVIAKVQHAHREIADGHPRREREDEVRL